MKTSSGFIYILLALFITSCDMNSNNDSSYLNDFEAIGFWTDGQNISRETASSGLFCTITDSMIPYTQTMKLDWKDIKVPQPKSATLIAWALTRDLSAKGKLVFSIETNNKNIIWEGTEVQTVVKEINKWYEVKLSIDLNKSIPKDAVVKVYGVNDGTKRIYWDNFQLQFNK